MCDNRAPTDSLGSIERATFLIVHLTSRVQDQRISEFAASDQGQTHNLEFKK